MKVDLTAYIENHGEAGFIAWIEGYKGLVVQGTSSDEVKRELFISFRTLIAYQFGLKLDDVKSKTLDQNIESIFLEQPQNPSAENSKSYRLQLAS